MIMNTRRMAPTVSAALDRAGFLPLVLFLAWASAEPEPGPERWTAAYRLAAVPALGVLAAAARARAPGDRVVLGANAYLVAGGALAWVAPDALGIFGGELRESGLLLAILAVGAATMLFSRHGYARVDPSGPRLASAALLAVTGAAALFSFRFRGDRFLAGTLPLAALLVASRLVARAYGRSP